VAGVDSGRFEPVRSVRLQPIDGELGADWRGAAQQVRDGRAGAQDLHDGVQLGTALGELGADRVAEPVGGDGATTAGIDQTSQLQACWMGVSNK
jgi:hypothetical protein